MKQMIVVRCKGTGIYFRMQWGIANPFVTMDVNAATRLEDSDKLREDFTRRFPYELEFIPVSEKVS